jgi:glutaminase
MAFVSTGRLPPPPVVAALVGEAHARFRDVAEGQVSGTYPALARVPADLCGVAVVGADGGVAEAGDSRHPFAIMSVSKPFVFALVCQELGAHAARARVGVNATGLPFDSATAIERAGGHTNPMVNAGAIATTAMAAGRDHEARWQFLREGLSRFAGRRLEVDAEIYASASGSNQKNRALALMLKAAGRLALDPEEAVTLYTLQCALGVTAHDLAVMGATLADGGTNPVTGERVVEPAACRHALAVMATAGLYETSGDWLYDVGLPGKSGIGGGIVTVSPGKGALGTFSPPLDAAGNSVRGQLVARFLADQLGLDLFTSAPLPPGGSMRPPEPSG